MIHVTHPSINFAILIPSEETLDSITMLPGESDGLIIYGAYGIGEFGYLNV